MTRPLRLLAVTGGHRVELDPFLAMLAAVCDEHGWAWSHAVQPGAQRWLTPELAESWDVALLHDLAGLRLQRGSEPAVDGPDEATRRSLRELLRLGKGFVVTHHALASWPGWDEWAHVVGGRFLYAPGSLDGAPWPASGYRMARHTVEVVAPEHPVCTGLDRFELDDELYLCPVFEDEITPLLVTTATMDGACFVDTYAEVRHGSTTARCADHPAGTRVVAWTKPAGASSVVYLQPGHGPETMGHPAYRRLLANAIGWVAPQVPAR